MPIDSSARARPCARAAARDSVAQRDEGRPRVLGSIDQPADGHQPVDLEVGQRQEPRAGRARARLGSKPALAGSSSTLTWRRTGSGASGRISPRSGRAARRGRASRPTRSTSNSSTPGAPCSTGADRRGATRRRGTAAPCLASWTRFSPRRSGRRDRRAERARRDRLRDGDDDPAGRARRGVTPRPRAQRLGVSARGRCPRSAQERRGGRDRVEPPAAGSRGVRRAVTAAEEGGISRSSASYAGRRAPAPAPADRVDRGRRRRPRRPRVAAHRATPARSSAALALELLEEVALGGARLADSVGAAAAAGRGGVALAAVEAGGDDGDRDLVAEPLVDARAEDDVRLGVGRGADLLGRLGDLEQATGSRRR